MLLRRTLLLFALFLGFTQAIAAQSDFQFSVMAMDTSSWMLSAVSDPQVYAGDLALTANPTINLIVGKRYAINDSMHGMHPFQIIANGGNPFSDAVLLAEDDSSGSFQGDAGVAWSDDGNGNIAFTLTPALLAAMRAGGAAPGYRCGVHTSTMRGLFAIFGDGSAIADPIGPRIPKGAVTIELTTVTSGLAAPLGADFSSDGRMFVFDQIGKVWIIQNGTTLPTPFLDVTGRLVALGVSGPGSYDERGLLGFALHPDFANNHKVYTHTSEPGAGAADFTVTLPQGASFDHQEVIAEWTVSAGDANAIDPASRRELLRVDKPQFNHNGGSIRFGQDGFLYVGLGDGGGADDSDGEPFLGGPTVGHGPGGNGQNVSVALGKILRLDVNTTNSANHAYGIPAGNPFIGKSGLPEIFYYGIRNPYAFSFDMYDGSLWLGDVGQNKIEEIDRLTAAQKGGNLGWRLKEGTFWFDSRTSQTGVVVTVPVAPPPPGLIDPIAEYDHDDGSAVIGGFVYHGQAVRELINRYIFGDFGGFSGPTGRLFYLDLNNVIKEFRIGPTDRGLGLLVKGFAQDPRGEVYLCGSTTLGPAGATGVVLKIVPYQPNAAGRHWVMYE